MLDEADSVTANVNNMRFIVNYWDNGVNPTITRLILNSQTYNLQYSSAYGPSPAFASYVSNEFPVSGGCREYYFEFGTATALRRYPTTGAFVTYGEGGCTENYRPGAGTIIHSISA